MTRPRSLRESFPRFDEEERNRVKVEVALNILTSILPLKGFAAGNPEDPQPFAMELE